MELEEEEDERIMAELEKFQNNGASLHPDLRANIFSRKEKVIGRSPMEHYILTGGQCYEKSSLTGKCSPQHHNLASNFRIASVQQTNYYYSDSSVIANYSDISSVSKCGDACLSDCGCVASVYGLNEEKPYCWILKSLEFGGFEDPGSTLFMKVQSNGSSTPNGTENPGNINTRKLVVLPVVLSFCVLVGLLCCMLYILIHRKRALKKALQSSLVVSGAPINFSFRDLQCSTNNFSQLLGTGGFGSVYKGSLGDGALIAVKKLDKVLPQGEREFITEVNAISSMHHMNLRNKPKSTKTNRPILQNLTSMFVFSLPHT